MGKFIDKTKGKIKQAAGALTGNKGLKKEGEQDERKGKIEGAVEGVKEGLTDAKNAIKKAVK